MYLSLMAISVLAFLFGALWHNRPTHTAKSLGWAT